MTSLRRLLLIGAAAACSACGPSDEEVVRAVRSYDERLIEAYRTSDARLIEPLTGEEEARKITALIGVKRDMGITLDAELVEFEVRAIERRGNELVVSTAERWYYQDRRIGTGERVGEDSRDRYWMRYHLRKERRGLVVVAVEFERPPEVGRTAAPSASRGMLHGVETRPPGEPPRANGLEIGARRDGTPPDGARAPGAAEPGGSR